MNFASPGTYQWLVATNGVAIAACFICTSGDALLLHGVLVALNILMNRARCSKASLQPYDFIQN